MHGEAVWDGIDVTTARETEGNLREASRPPFFSRTLGFSACRM